METNGKENVEFLLNQKIKGIYMVSFVLVLLISVNDALLPINSL